LSLRYSDSVGSPEGLYFIPELLIIFGEPVKIDALLDLDVYLKFLPVTFAEFITEVDEWRSLIPLTASSLLSFSSFSK